MIARVTKVTEGGWWVLKMAKRNLPDVHLPTWMLPRDVRYTDRVHVERSCGTVGFWKVTKVVRCVRSHPGRRAFRS